MLVDRHFVCSATLGKGDLNHRLHQMLIADEEVSDAEACKELYGKESAHAFVELKRVFKDEMLTVGLQQPETSKFRVPLLQQMHKARRLALIGSTLLSRDMDREGAKYVQRALKICEKNELVLQAADCYEILLVPAGLSKGFQSYQELKDKYQHKLRLCTLLEEAKETLRSITLGEFYETNKHQEIRVSTEKKIEKLQQLWEESQLINVKYMLLRSTMMHLFYDFQFEKAEDMAAEVEDLLKEHSFLNSSNNFAGLQMTRSYFCVSMGKNQRAIHHAKIAVQNFKTGGRNELLAIQGAFEAYLACGDLEQAGSYLENALTHPKFELRSKLGTKWAFYAANHSFLNGDFERCRKYLHRSQELTKDREGWQFGYRYLELLLLFEQGDLDTSYLESFQRHLRNKKGITTIARIKTIIDVLAQLHKSDFDFVSTADKCSSKLELLNKGHELFFWNPAGFELVRFDKWFSLKMEEQKARRFNRN